MATLQDLYDDIKELIHQKFETKTEEDTTLPQIVESYFNYNQGELDIDIPHMKLKVTGSSFETYSSTPFTYTGEIFVDWGDGSFVEYTSGKLSHSFTDGNSNHTVKIYGNITSLGDFCFDYCTGLTSITLSNSITSLGDYCFDSCTGLTLITLNWIENDILTYEPKWIYLANSNLKFSIPQGTTEYYIQAGYPSNKLMERN